MADVEAQNELSVFGRLTRFVKDIFKTNVEIFLEALKLSPNAQGYVSGSITELLLKRELESRYQYEVKRIREKWEGRKHSNHYGDFYFRKPSNGHWYVMESKGVKSNSEKWHKLYNYADLKSFLISHAEKIQWINPAGSVDAQVTGWIDNNLPKFRTDYAETLYEFEEVQKYLTSQPRRLTEKAKAISFLREHSREQISTLIRERLTYVMSKIRVLETHFVSGTSGSSQRTQATPRKDEFNVISVDVFLRHDEHRFLFANPKHLDSSGSDPNHLRQNYIMGFIFPTADGSLTLSVTEEWYVNLEDVYETLDPEDSINESEMQVDSRNVVVIGVEE